MKTIMLIAATLSLCANSVEATGADVSTSFCTSPYVKRDFGTTDAVIYYSLSSAATYRVCTLKASPIQVTALNPNGVQMTFDVAGNSCFDVSTAQLSIKANPATTGNSVVYCKIG